MSEALANLDGNLSGDMGSATAYTGQVYLGEVPIPSAKGVIRGKKIDTGKTTTPKTLSIQQAKNLYLTDPKVRENWKSLLSKYGMSTNELEAKAVWDVSIAGASDWYATSNGQQKITPQQYLTWYVGGKKKKQPAVPTRQIYAATPEQIAADINDIAVKTLGREIQDADTQAEWYQDLLKGINKLYQKGTVTEVKEVVNPKTGKKEKVVTQTPGFSKEQVAEKITGAVQAADPESLDRKQRLDFTKWLYGRGGQG